MITNCSSEDQIAKAVARELLAIEAAEPLRVALTGGTLGIAVIRELAKNPPEPGRFRFVFGDERFVALNDAHRNEFQALSSWPGLAADLLRYPEPSETLAEARASFEEKFEVWMGTDQFDLVILGMGPDGHVASLFPGHDRPGRLVVAEPDSPKPPSARLSLSYRALNNSRRIWFVVSGSAKVSASVCSYRENCDLPAARVRGFETRWFVDDVIARALS